MTNKPPQPIDEAPNSFDELRNQIFCAGEVTYKPFTSREDKLEQVVKLPLDELMRLILTHRNAELEKLLEQANTYSNDGDFSDGASSLVDAVPVSAIKDLMEEIE